MFGLLFSTAMLGLATIGWPVYLHVRKRREQQIQIVPSLRIFGFTSQRARKMHLQQLILLLARAAILLFLFALVAQPFISSSRRLSWLPLALSDDATGPCLGIVVDDSIFSLQAKNGRSRMEAAQTHLLHCLERIPENVHVSFTTTSYGHPTPPMSTTNAAAFVKTLRSVPRLGNGTEALRELANALKGRPGRILLVASRERALWPPMPPLDELGDEKIPSFFCDATERRLPAFVRSAEAGIPGTPDTWLFRFEGAPERLQGRRLSVSTGDRVLLSTALSLPQAMAKALRLTPSPDAPPVPCIVSLESDDEHPWLTRYFTPQGGVSSGRGTLTIIRPQTRSALLADKILSAALLAIRPDLEILHLGPDRPEDLPQAGAATVLVDASVPLGTGAQWLEDTAARGHHILFCRTEAPSHEDNSILPGLTWGPLTPVERTDAFPLRLALEGKTSRNLDELLLGGLQELPLTNVLSFSSTPPLVPILSTASGQVVVARYPAAPQGTRLLLAAPLTLDPDGPALHPLFPLLLERLLWDDVTASAQKEGIPEANAPTDLCAWLGLPQARGELVSPDGTRSTWNCSATDRTTFVPPVAGVYRFEDRTGLVTTHCVNPVVPPETDDVGREEWQQQHPDCRLQWSKDEPPPDEWLQGNDAGLIGETERRYDLSAVALAFILAACAVEQIALMITWRRPQSVPSLPRTSDHLQT